MTECAPCARLLCAALMDSARWVDAAARDGQPCNRREARGRPRSSWAGQQRVVVARQGGWGSPLSARKANSCLPSSRGGQTRCAWRDRRRGEEGLASRVAVACIHVWCDVMCQDSRAGRGRAAAGHRPTQAMQGSLAWQPTAVAPPLPGEMSTVSRPPAPRALIQGFGLQGEEAELKGPEHIGGGQRYRPANTLHSSHRLQAVNQEMTNRMGLDQPPPRTR